MTSITVTTSGTNMLTDLSTLLFYRALHPYALPHEMNGQPYAGRLHAYALNTVVRVLPLLAISRLASSRRRQTTSGKTLLTL